MASGPRIRHHRLSLLHYTRRECACRPSSPSGGGTCRRLQPILHWGVLRRRPAARRYTGRYAYTRTEGQSAKAAATAEVGLPRSADSGAPLFVGCTQRVSVLRGKRKQRINFSTIRKAMVRQELEHQTDSQQEEHPSVVEVHDYHLWSY